MNNKRKLTIADLLKSQRPKKEFDSNVLPGPSDFVNNKEDVSTGKSSQATEASQSTKKSRGTGIIYAIILHTINIE